MRAKVLAAIAICAGAAGAPRAHALGQPDGTPIPTKMGCSGGQPTGLAAIFAAQCTAGGPNIGAPWCSCSSSGPVGAWPIALAMILIARKRRRPRRA